MLSDLKAAELNGWKVEFTADIITVKYFPNVTRGFQEVQAIQIHLNYYFWNRIFICSAVLYCCECRTLACSVSRSHRLHGSPLALHYIKAPSCEEAKNSRLMTNDGKSFGDLCLVQMCSDSSSWLKPFPIGHRYTKRSWSRGEIISLFPALLQFLFFWCCDNTNLLHHYGLYKFCHSGCLLAYLQKLSVFICLFVGRRGRRNVCTGLPRLFFWRGRCDDKQEKQTSWRPEQQCGCEPGAGLVSECRK